MPRKKLEDIYKLDEVDNKILRLLQEDARRSFKDMAGRVNVSEATVFVRVKKLLKNGVIRAFRADQGQTYHIAPRPYLDPSWRQDVFSLLPARDI